MGLLSATKVAPSAPGKKKGWWPYGPEYERSYTATFRTVVYIMLGGKGSRISSCVLLDKKVDNARIMQDGWLHTIISLLS